MDTEIRASNETGRRAGGNGAQGPPRNYLKEAVAELRALLFRGKGIECSCCGRNFRHFLYSPYLTSTCPYCMSVERYRLLCRYLVEELSLGSSPVRLLDIAPLWCFQEFCRRVGNVDYVSVDIASPLAMFKMDINDLQFEDESFDCLICYHVLEHLEDDRRALEELYRVLKPGGWAMIQVPVEVEQTIERSSLDEKEAQRLLRWENHLRVYGKDFVERPRSVGFEVEVSQYVKRYGPDDINRLGLDASEDLYLCRKPVR